MKREQKQINMPSHLMLVCHILFIFKFNNAFKTCFEESTHLNYLFLKNLSQIKIPLIPHDCSLCQSAYQVDIQLIDEQLQINRTIQRIKIFLKNFEIEDSSYICLRNICPILVEYGSDSIVLNVTSTLFSHVFLSLNYSVVCSIQTRFAIFALEKAITCTEDIYLHPRLDIQIVGRLFIYDCRADLFERDIYQTSVRFHRTNFPTNNQITTMKSSGKTCEYILENTSYLRNISLIEIDEIVTTVTILPLHNPWRKDIQTLGPCQTKLIPYEEMFFTGDIVNIRNIYIKQGQTIQIRCPIDGSKKYLKYVWYYQRYQPKYQISTNRTIILSNITEHMQGKYMCIGDDGNENLEFEMTLHISDHNKTNKTLLSPTIILIIIIIIILILVCFIVTLIIYFSLRKSPSTNNSIHKPNSLTIHHDVMLTIQQTSNSLWNQAPYHTLDYIDEQPIYHIPPADLSSNQITPIPSLSWIKPSNSKQILHRLSTRHRNVNGQPPAQLSVHMPLLESNSDITLPFIVKFNEISDSLDNSIHDDIEILKISIPSLTEYPLVKSTNSIISFDSQIEVDEFNQMTFVCV